MGTPANYFWRRPTSQYVGQRRGGGAGREAITPVHSRRQPGPPLGSNVRPIDQTQRRPPHSGHVSLHCGRRRHSRSAARARPAHVTSLRRSRTAQRTLSTSHRTARRQLPLTLPTVHLRRHCAGTTLKAGDGTGSGHAPAPQTLCNGRCGGPVHSRGGRRRLTYGWMKRGLAPAGHATHCASSGRHWAAGRRRLASGRRYPCSLLVASTARDLHIALAR